MRFRCAKCEHVFTDREVICEDWNIPEKAFGCPSCNAFLRDPRKQPTGVLLLKQLKNSAIAMFVVFLVFGTIWKIDEYFGVPSVYMYLGLLPIILWYAYKNPTQPLLALPYE
ncbi:MAG: NAD-dependent SIR2 family protein deacetylase [Oleiphilaceae bacterium]|jgi:NAD-dependent SIR2 family protein deacetylase